MNGTTMGVILRLSQRIYTIETRKLVGILMRASDEYIYSVEGIRDDRRRVEGIDMVNDG